MHFHKKEALWYTVLSIRTLSKTVYNSYTQAPTCQTIKIGAKLQILNLPAYRVLGILD